MLSLKEREAKMAFQSRQRHQRRLERDKKKSAMEQSARIDMNTAAPFCKIPAELFGRVAEFLPPHSLANLSSTCKRFHGLLSFELGNTIWYKAVPPALLMSPVGSYKSSKPLAAVIGHGSNVSSARGGNPLDRPKCLDASFQAERLILGGPYSASVDYAKEIKGHVSTGERCYICLTERRRCSGRIVCTKRWGMLLCTACLEDASLSHAALNVMLPSRVLLKDYRGPVSFVNTEKIFYQPSVDGFLREYLGKGLLNLKLDRKVQDFDKLVRRLTLSPMEEHRRQLRLRVITAAEGMWEGKTPLPIIIREGCHCGHVHPKKPSREVIWRTFRDRYVSVSQLRKFLFPAVYLVDNPATLTAYGQHQPHQGYWLPDPTLQMTTIQHFADILPCKVAEMAFYMLHELVNDHWCFTSRNMVNALTDAANQFHKQRLELELSSGATLRMDHITPALLTNNPSVHRGIVNLRTKLGHPVPEIVPDGQPLSDEEQAAYDRRERNVNKYFSKIAAQACMRCPVSGLMFIPVGLDGLLEHMRMEHPMLFWLSTFHCLA